MNHLQPETYEFVCPERGEQFEVDDEMRRALLANGCPVCGAPVSPDAFVAVSPS